MKQIVTHNFEKVETGDKFTDIKGNHCTVTHKYNNQDNINLDYKTENYPIVARISISKSGIKENTDYPVVFNGHLNLTDIFLYLAGYIKRPRAGKVYLVRNNTSDEWKIRVVTGEQNKKGHFTFKTLSNASKHTHQYLFYKMVSIPVKELPKEFQ